MDDLDESMDLDAAFARLAGDVRAADAARGRTRERHLLAAAAADATLSGVLLDLAEQDDEVTLRTATGRKVRGRIVVVASDAIVVESSAGLLTFVPLDAVTSVRPTARRRRREGASLQPGGDRRAPRGVTLAAIVAELAGLRPRVALAVRGEAELVTGELWAAGTNLLTVRMDGDPAVTVYVSLRQLSELTVLASG